MFGEYEVIKNVPREESMICESRTGELYVLSKYVNKGFQYVCLILK